MAGREKERDIDRDREGDYLLDQCNCCVWQVWKVSDAHDDAIRDVAWSPLMPHWLASAGDDGCIQVYDIRFGDRPLKTLQCTNALHSVCVRGASQGKPSIFLSCVPHFTACVSPRCHAVLVCVQARVNMCRLQVNWSHAHAEMLVSGGVDQRLRLWNLRMAPHHLVETISTPFEAPIVSTAFSQTHPHQYMATDALGDLVRTSFIFYTSVDAQARDLMYVCV